MFPCSCGAEKISVTHPLPPSSFQSSFLWDRLPRTGGAEAPAARLKFDIGILLPFWQFDGFFVVGLLRPDFTCVALIHHCGKKRGLAFCPSVLHFSFTFVFVSNSVFVWRLFCLGSALVILFPFRLFEKGQD